MFWVFLEGGGVGRGSGWYGGGLGFGGRLVMVWVLCLGGGGCGGVGLEVVVWLPRLSVPVAVIEYSRLVSQFTPEVL